MSEIALVAAIRPNVYGSSTSGVKKSRVVTTARSSEMRQTAASSSVSLPTSSSGAVTPISAPLSTWESSPAGSLQAHPAPWDSCVSRISASVAIPGIIGTTADIVAFVARLLYRLGRLVAAHPVIVLLIWVAAAAGVTLVVKQVGSETSNNVDLPGTGSQLATDLLQAGFPPQQNGSNPIIFKVTKGKVTDSANKQAITDSYKAIKKIGFVHSATSPFSQDGQGQVSKDGKIAFISVLLSISSNELTEEEAQRVMNAAEPGVKAAMQVEGGGSIGSTLSPNDTSTSDLIGILAAMLILRSQDRRFAFPLIFVWPAVFVASTVLPACIGIMPPQVAFRCREVSSRAKTLPYKGYGQGSLVGMAVQTGVWPFRMMPSLLLTCGNRFETKTRIKRNWLETWCRDKSAIEFGAGRTGRYRGTS